MLNPATGEGAMPRIGRSDGFVETSIGLDFDDGLPDGSPPAENGQPLSTQAEWKAFKRKTSEQRLYLDYFIG